MKKLFKLVPVALGLLAFASCSNDDFANEGASVQQAEAGDLIVTSADLEDDGVSGTRSFLSRDMQKRMYVTSDELKVYDNDLHKYDIYKFSWNDENKESGVFRRWNTASNIKEAAWALYPQADVVSGIWEYNEITENTETRVTMNIPQEMIYDGTYDLGDKEFKTPLFKDVLPRWGQVTSTADGKLQTNLSYLTGVLRLQLAGIPDYATDVKVMMLEGGLAANPVAMTGDFETIIAKNDVKQADAKLAGVEGTPGVDDFIHVDLTQAGLVEAPLLAKDAPKAVVFVPLVTTTKAVDIVIYLSNDGGATYEEYSRFKNKVIQRGKVYGNSKEYNLALDGEGPEAISDALDYIETTDGENVTLTFTGDIDVCDPDNTILVPNKKAASITIDLSQVTVNTTCGSDLYVKYKDASGEGKFAGTVAVKTGNHGGNVNMIVNLDSTPFKFIGDEAGDITSISSIDATAFTIGEPWQTTKLSAANYDLSTNVKTLTIAQSAETDDITTTWAAYPLGNGQNVEKIIVNGNVTGNITATAVNYLSQEVTVEGSAWDGVATVAGDIATNGPVNVLAKATFTGTDITAGGNITFDTSYDGAQTIAGSLTSLRGNVSINNASNNYATFTADITTGPWVGGADFTITGKAKSDGGTVTTKNAKIDVTPNNGNCEAITNELKYAANGKLELLTGYVGTVNPNGKTVTLSFAEKGSWAAMNVTAGAEDNVRPGDNVSIWNGKDFPAALRATYTTTDQIWTATQLGTQSIITSSNTPTTYVPEIRSNIDLDNKDWKGIYADADYALNGKANPNEASKTIKNINLVQTKVGSKHQAGFIYQADATVYVEDLSLAGVKTSIKALGGEELKGVGGFVGVAAGAVTMNRVNVKLAAGYFGSMDGTKNVTASNIGGIIGRAEGALTLKGCTADLTGAILAGHRSLGGFVGGAKGTVDILTDPELGDRPETACAVTGLTQMWVTLLDLQEYENDPEQGSTGLYIGQVNLGSMVTIEDAADVNPSFTVGGKVDESKAFIVTSNKVQQFSRGDQKLIGQSGYSIIGPDYKINGQKYGVKKTGESFTDGNKVLYNVTVASFH